ncbi:class I SAM-dependent methyltransferase [Pseudonocardia acaciae]|uniref:methyltransferase domain-containing protein n=1 Tax=Pseudonocardia acaciae TaxID=551276 RepID=UPI00048E727A|nr:class I SAM-dependent methyltransferase [Pseudonocardia acaciae]
MEGYDASTYGDLIADVYDRWHPRGEGTETIAALLAELAGGAGGGRALELAIGTGRIALPLAERGVEVHGIDASEAMVAELRTKPGGGRIPVALGDFADVAVEGRFRLVYVVFNTFFALLTQAEQVRCFRNVAERLTDDGVFVIEAFVPDPKRFERQQSVNTNRVTVDEVLLDVSRHDPVAQRIDSQHMLMRAEGIRLLPVSLRYAWPSELDLMAQLAGLRLRERWAGWRREPFTAASGAHVSVYGRPGSP